MTTIRHEALVPLTAAGRRFDQALAEMFPDYSRSRLSGWIKSGSVTLDGAQAPPRQLLRGGEQVLLQVELETEVSSTPEAIALDIVHEDEHLLVLNKPAGLVVHPGAGNSAGTLLNALLHHDPKLAELPRAGIVHRNDPWMFQARQNVRLSLQTGRELAAGIRDVENFYRHPPAERRILGQIHRAHATAPDAIDQAITRSGEIRLGPHQTQSRDRLIRKPVHAGSTPSSARASRRNSASEQVISRSFSNAMRRNSRRANAR